jgi:hypothetical protein
MLGQLIESIPEWDTKTAQQLADILNAPSVPKVDTESWTWRGVFKLIGNENLNAIKAKLIELKYDWAVDCLSGVGLVLSDPAVQDLLSALIVMGVPGALELKNQGIRNVSICADKGLQPVTPEVIAQEVLKLKLRDKRQFILQDAAMTYNAFVDYVSTNYDGSGDEPKLVAFNDGQ